MLDGRLWPTYGVEGGEERSMCMVSGKMEKRIESVFTETLQRQEPECPYCAKQSSQNCGQF